MPDPAESQPPNSNNDSGPVVDTYDGDDRCWICLEARLTGPTSRWRHICKCNLRAHEECLLNWMRTGAEDARCPQCHEPVRMRGKSSILLTLRDTAETIAGYFMSNALIVTVAQGLTGIVYSILYEIGSNTIQLMCSEEEAKSVLGEQYSFSPFSMSNYPFPLTPVSLFRRTGKMSVEMLRTMLLGPRIHRSLESLHRAIVVPMIPIMLAIPNQIPLSLQLVGLLPFGLSFTRMQVLPVERKILLFLMLHRLYRVGYTAIMEPYLQTMARTVYEEGGVVPPGALEVIRAQSEMERIDLGQPEVEPEARPHDEIPGLFREEDFDQAREGEDVSMVCKLLIPLARASNNDPATVNLRPGAGSDDEGGNAAPPRPHQHDIPESEAWRLFMNAMLAGRPPWADEYIQAVKNTIQLEQTAILPLREGDAILPATPEWSNTIRQLRASREFDELHRELLDIVVSAEAGELYPPEFYEMRQYFDRYRTIAFIHGYRFDLGGAFEDRDGKISLFRVAAADIMCATANVRGADNPEMVLEEGALAFRETFLKVLRALSPRERNALATAMREVSIAIYGLFFAREIDNMLEEPGANNAILDHVFAWTRDIALDPFNGGNESDLDGDDEGDDDEDEDMDLDANDEDQVLERVEFPVNPSFGSANWLISKRSFVLRLSYPVIAPYIVAGMGKILALAPWFGRLDMLSRNLTAFGLLILIRDTVNALTAAARARRALRKEILNYNEGRNDPVLRFVSLFDRFTNGVQFDFNAHFNLIRDQ